MKCSIEIIWIGNKIRYRHRFRFSLIRDDAKFFHHSLTSEKYFSFGLLQALDRGDEFALRHREFCS